jgi:hypothetical protein
MLASTDAVSVSVKVIKLINTPRLEMIDEKGLSRQPQPSCSCTGGLVEIVPRHCLVFRFGIPRGSRGTVLKYSNGSILQGEGGEETVLDVLAITSGHRPRW